MDPTPMMSRLRLNPANAAARRDITNRDGMHKTLCDIVDAARAAGNILWRYEHDDLAGPAVLLQSALPPNPAALIEGYGTLEGPHSLGAHFERLANGRTVEFRLVANPIIKHRPSGRHGPKHRRAVPRGELPAWMDRHARTAGLAPHADSLRITASSETHPRHRSAKLHVARFDGYADITDSDALAAAIAAGVGASRAYGCGLLTVSKPR